MSIQAKMFFQKDFPTGGSKIPVGIHEGTVVFSGITYEDGYYDINFTSDSGQTLHKRLFLPTGSKPKEKETVQDAVKREQDKNISQFANLLEALLGEELASQVEAPDYQSFMAKVMLILNTQSKGTRVNLKVVPDWKEQKYPDLPLFRYVELHVPGTPTNLAFTKDQAAAIQKMEANRATPNVSNDFVV